MGKAQTFLVKGETRRGPTLHLNVVVSGADEDQNYLVVPVTTYYEHDGIPARGQDESCILPAQSHPFIVHKSYACYSRARKMSYTEIYNGLRQGILVSKQDMAPFYLQEIQRGAEASPHLPEELSHFFEYFLKD
jgi:hypothetical protein